MKLTYKEQQKLFDKGHTLMGKDGVKKKILRGDPFRGIGPCLGFMNPEGTWFYGAGYFPEDEDLIVE